MAATAYPSVASAAPATRVGAMSVDPFFLACTRMKRRDFDGAIEICNTLLAHNPVDQAVWMLKCRCLTEKAFVDDSDWDEEGIGEVLLDDNAIATAPRPGTSILRPSTSAVGARPGTSQDAALRPMTAGGRPVTGFARPGTTRPTTGSAGMSVDAAFRGGRPGTSRAMTALGRQVRLGTASLASTPGGPFINVDRIDLRKYAARPAIAKALCDYIMYVDHNPRKGMELAAAATVHSQYNDWWWKLRLGKCYYQLGLLRDAEKQFKSSIRQQPMIATHLELAKVYMKLDQPAVAQETYMKGSELFRGEPSMLLGAARLHDTLGELEKGAAMYRKVLGFDAANIEAIACLASSHFYGDQPEVALKYYRRLLQMGVQTPELWNNLGLCCFYASQYDMTLSCFDRAVGIAEDDSLGDIWYNIGHVAIGIGDLGLAYQAFRVAVSADPAHAEAYTNLGVLEMRKGNVEAARSNFTTAQRMAAHLFEPFYNGALLAYKLGDFQEAYTLVSRALENFPDHSDSQELMRTLRAQFNQL